MAPKVPISAATVTQLVRDASANGRRRVNRAVIGGTGISHFGFIAEDFIPGLNGQTGVRAYREMMDNDPVIFAMLYAITMLLRGVTWRVEPAAGDDVDEDRAQIAADFIKSVFFEDMERPFAEFISEVVSLIGYGHDLHEIVYKIRGGATNDPTTRSRFADQRIGIRKLSPRAQDTIWRWDMDDEGDVKGVWQVLPDRAEVYIPADKLLLFRTSTNKNNPEGRSALRGCYVPYQRKQAIEAAEGRAAMRSAGLVELAIPASFMAPDASDPEKQVFNAYKKVADTVAQDRQGSIVLPSDRDEHGNRMFSVAYVSTEGRRPVDMTPVIERYDKRMAASLLADFILLGQQSVGSFALSSDKTQLFSRSLAAYLDMIAAPLNRKLIPALWELNGFDEALMPTLVPADVSARDLKELGTYVTQLVTAGARFFPDIKLENVLRDEAGLPELTKEGLQEMQDAKDQEMQDQQDQFAQRAAMSGFGGAQDQQGQQGQNDGG